MIRPILTAGLALALCETAWGARCTTALDVAMLPEYHRYVSAAEQAMAARFHAGELAWVPAALRKNAAADLAAGKLVRSNRSDPAFNQRFAGRNITVLHWIGAIRIEDTRLSDLISVLEDYPRYARIYRPMIYTCQAKPVGALGEFDVVLGLQSTFRFAGIFPQRYAFRVYGRMTPLARGPSVVFMQLRAEEIRESDSGIPSREDYLEIYHDHGILWALNAYWRARQSGAAVYLEFETITLARSVQAFACKVGFLPVPKSVVSAAMDSLPADSVTVILEGTRAECARRAAPRTAESLR